MTIEQKLENMCVERGLWRNEASTVVAKYKKEVHDYMEHRWNDDISCYPPALLAVLFLGVKRQALAYIDANKPQHSARQLFLD